MKNIQTYPVLLFALSALLVKSTPTEPAPSAPTFVHTVKAEELSLFAIPLPSIQGLSLTQAIDEVIETYQRTCEKNQTQPLKLNVQVIEPTEKDLSYNAVMGLCGMSSKSNNGLVKTLKSLALATDAQLEIQGNNFKFKPHPKFELTISDFAKKVSPDFILNSCHLDHDLFDSPTPECSKLKELLHLNFKVGVEYDPKTSQLKATNVSPLEKAKLNQLIDLVDTIKPRQVRIRAKIMTIKNQALALNGLLNEGAMIEIYRDKAESTETLPSITSRLGQSATIELIKELGLDGRSEFIGKKYKLTPKASGHSITLSGSIHMHELDANGQLQKYSCNLSKTIPPGYTYLKQIHGDAYLAISTAVIDATGELLVSPK